MKKFSYSEYMDQIRSSGPCLVSLSAMTCSDANEVTYYCISRNGTGTVRGHE